MIGGTVTYFKSVMGFISGQILILVIALVLLRKIKKRSSKSEINGD